MITSKYLTEYALAQVNRPYWIGGCGHRATKDLFYRLKNQYPTVLKDAKWEGDYQNDESEKVHDCCGLIKGASWCAGVNQYFTGGKEYQSNGCMDWSVSEMYKHCAETGSVDKLPEIPGLLLFNEKKSHVGIYIGQGIVVEARGHAYGVQKNKLKDRSSFKRWGKASWVNYEDKPAEKDHVKDFQAWLNKTYGERLLVDGIYGAYTKRAAARAFASGLKNAFLNTKVGTPFRIIGELFAKLKAALQQLFATIAEVIASIGQALLIGLVIIIAVVLVLMGINIGILFFFLFICIF